MLARLGLVVVAPLLVAGTLVTPQLVTTTQSEQVKMSDSQTARSMDLLAVPRGDSRRNLNEDDEATDVYGNEVAAAVAKYTLDATGSLYELHSPQTELPRLGPPKS
jgi:hypothetical protein